MRGTRQRRTANDIAHAGGRIRARALCALVVLLCMLCTLAQPAFASAVCGIAEHSHGSACYTRKLSCGQEEGEAHSHGDGCYSVALTCGQAEHSHGSACYPQEVGDPTEEPGDPTQEPSDPTEEPGDPTEEPGDPTEEPSAPTQEPGDSTQEPSAPTQEPGDGEPADAPEPAGKLSARLRCEDRACFEGDRVSFELSYSGGVEPVQCAISVRQGGDALASLDAFQDSVTVRAGKGGTISAVITVTDATGATARASCRVPCAVHKTESPAQWAASARTSLTGAWPRDLLAVARTQLGYGESDENFIVKADGSQQGYTRYGDWFGAPYDAWCAMYVSFCLNYAEIPASGFPRDGICARWVENLRGLGLYAPADEARPQPGDLIFFDKALGGVCDHVGIVTEVSDGEITTIEGNSGKVVCHRSYAPDDRRILGYGLLNAAYARSAGGNQGKSAPEAAEPVAPTESAPEAENLAGVDPGARLAAADASKDAPEGEATRMIFDAEPVAVDVPHESAGMR